MCVCMYEYIVCFTVIASTCLFLCPYVLLFLLSLQLSLIFQHHKGEKIMCAAATANTSPTGRTIRNHQRRHTLCVVIAAGCQQQLTPTFTYTNGQPTTHILQQQSLSQREAPTTISWIAVDCAIVLSCFSSLL